MRQAIAGRDSIVPSDSEAGTDAIIERALLEERPSVPRWVRPVTARELGFQRRMSVIVTVGPLAGVAAAIAWLWGHGIAGLDLGLLIGFYAFSGLGVTVGFHRLFTHRSFEVSSPIRGVLAVAGTMAIEGGPIEWSATHRRHHAYADAYGDPHSPHLVERNGIRGVLYGLWHAHMGWLFDPNGSETSRWTPDLERDPVLAGVARWAPGITLASFLLPPALAFAVTRSWQAAVTGFLWGSLVRIFLLHHVTWSINSICHFFGKRPFQTRDESTNNWPLSVISFGESWHNNHHAFPTSARHGLLRGQLDPSWRVIRTLEQLHLARGVRLPTERMMAKRRVVKTDQRARHAQDAAAAGTVPSVPPPQRHETIGAGPPTRAG
jgi:stearoyl-CoA desaturase (Delta-9 desaturase)